MKANKINLKGELSNLVDEMGENEQLNIIKSKKKAKPKDGFVMMFDKNLSNLLDESNITIGDIRVLLSICYYVNWGNLINLTHQTVADDLGMVRQQVSRSFKKLENAGVIFKEKGSLFLNPNYLVKGDLYKAKDSKAYTLTKNNLYKELGEYIKDPEELEKKVHEMMAFWKE